MGALLPVRGQSRAAGAPSLGRGSASAVRPASPPSSLGAARSAGGWRRLRGNSGRGNCGTRERGGAAPAPGPPGGAGAATKGGGDGRTGTGGRAARAVLAAGAACAGLTSRAALSCPAAPAARTARQPRQGRAAPAAPQMKCENCTKKVSAAAGSCSCSPPRLAGTPSRGWGDAAGRDGLVWSPGRGSGAGRRPQGHRAPRPHPRPGRDTSRGSPGPVIAGM